MITIDSHQHFWKFNPTRDTWITDEMKIIARNFGPGDLLPVLRENQVDGCIAVQADPSEAETEFLLDLAMQYPIIKGVVGWVDLLDPGVTGRLAHYAANPCLKGIRYIVQTEPADFLYHPNFRNGISQLDQFGLPYDLLVYPKHLPGAIDMVAAFPTQTFVLDHLGKPDIRSGKIKEWAGDIEQLARFPNVSCKVSGMVTEADWKGWSYEDFTPYLDVIFANFGLERILFGSDWPVCLLAADYSSVMGILARYIDGYSPIEKANIWGLNATRIYKL